MIRRSLPPVSLVVAAFVAVKHVGKTWTPALKREGGSVLVLSIWHFIPTDRNSCS